MLNIGKMSHRIHFRNSDGTQASPDYWCEMKHINSVGMYVAGTLGQVESLEIRMRYVKYGPNKDVEPKTGQAILIDGQYEFQIKTIENVNLANEEWHMIVTR